jgi:sigma-B regulation protein RsbU (phosphoserine phosphatase)
VDLARAPAPRILIADDQPDVRVALHLLLKGEGYGTESVDSPGAILAAVERGGFDALLMDLNYTRDTTSGREGLDLLPRVRAVDAGIPVVVMTAWGTIGLAVEAMRRGANDFVLKPWDNAALLSTVRSQVEGRARGGEPRSEPARAGVAPRDLEIARRVQSQLLPQQPPELRTLDCAACCLQAGAVGGDAFDFVRLAEDRVAIALADASGKGLGAALLMASLQGALRSHASRALDDMPSMLRSVNELFLATTAPEHFATLFFGCYDDATRRLRYANCGHYPPMLLRAGGALERLDPTAPALGLMEDWACAEAAVEIAAGDRLVVFSDGVTEATNARGEEFGESRLLEVLRSGGALASRDLIASVVEAVAAFSDGRHEDDLTLVALAGLQS